jgi:two-component system OmpR family sensor kinase
MIRRTGYTFRGRLTAVMTALAIAVLAAAGLTIYAWARDALVTTFDRALMTVAQSEVASAVDEPDGRVHVHEGAIRTPPERARVAYEKVSRIRSEDGAVDVSTSNLAGGPALATDPALEARAYRGTVSLVDARRGGEVYRAVYYPFTNASGRRFLALVAIPKAPLERTLSSLMGVLAVCLVAGAGAAAWAANRLARRLTRPLEQIAASARRVGQDTLGARIPEESPDAELRALTAILNDMLARLETAFAAERRFVADASHELRSPLSNIRGTIEVTLRRPRSEAEYRETLVIALAEVERLSRIVSTLLTLSRADAGQLGLSFRPCSLTALADEAARAHQARAAERGVHLTVEAPSEVTVRGDVDRLREVLDNLLDNALRHAPPASDVLIQVRRDGERGWLGVRDAGPGLSPEDQAHVFERFFRADRSRARNSGGLGLGLAIARAIVEAHGGRLRVESGPGAGSLFSFDVPIVRPGAVDEAPASRMGAAAPTAAEGPIGAP